MLTVRQLRKEDMKQFVFLWEKFLRENLGDGGTVLASKNNLEFFKTLAKVYLQRPEIGCVYTAWNGKIPLGVVMWGAPPVPGLETTQGTAATGWGSYVVPEARKLGISRELRQHAAKHLWAYGYKKLNGSVDLKNEASVKSVEDIGFKTTTVNVELDLSEAVRA